MCVSVHELSKHRVKDTYSDYCNINSCHMAAEPGLFAVEEDNAVESNIITSKLDGCYLAFCIICLGAGFTFQLSGTSPSLSFSALFVDHLTWVDSRSHIMALKERKNNIKRTNPKDRKSPRRQNLRSDTACLLALESTNRTLTGIRYSWIYPCVASVLRVRFSFGHPTTCHSLE
jgi:hypothetical protein